MADYAITKIEQTTEFSPDLETVEVYKITFTVEGQGPFTVSVPVKDYTASKGREAVMLKAQEIAATLGI